MNLLTLLVILLVVAVVFGGYGSTRSDWGLYSWSPVGLILLIVLVLLLTGNLHV